MLLNLCEVLGAAFIACESKTRQNDVQFGRRTSFQQV
jgi:hypothetical protein